MAGQVNPAIEKLQGALLRKLSARPSRRELRERKVSEARAVRDGYFCSQQALSNRPLRQPHPQVLRFSEIFDESEVLFSFPVLFLLLFSLRIEHTMASPNYFIAGWCLEMLHLFRHVRDWELAACANSVAQCVPTRSRLG